MTAARTPDPDPIEILARFARSASKDAPQGTLIIDGHDPLRFAGWLDLMAIVEQLLDDERVATSAGEQPGSGSHTPEAREDVR